MIQHLRVGITIIGRSNWPDGQLYIETLIKAVSSIPKPERPQLFLVVAEENLVEFKAHRSIVSLLDGIIFVGPDLVAAEQIVELPLMHCNSEDELFRKIDLYFPVIVDALPGRCAVSCIPEIPHLHMPELFSQEELIWRNEACKKIAEQARFIVFGSSSDEKQFLKLYSSCKAVTKVLALPACPEKDWYDGDPVKVQNQYGLPDHFVLCCNPFLLHKNHPILFKALALARHAGQDLHLVCIGSVDCDPEPDYFRKLQTYVKNIGIADYVHILGEIPDHDRIQLIRRSLFVIQPSLNERLRLIVQECRALGKTIILSDLGIHLEQGYGTIFDGTNAGDLARKIIELVPQSLPGPDLQREREAKQENASIVEAFAKEFNNLVEQSQFIANKGEFEKTKVNLIHSVGANDIITIATSLVPGRDLDNQRKAICSWQNIGFKVVSINAPDEIVQLQEYFEDVEFVSAKRDARDEFGTPYIYLDDVLGYFAANGGRVCGIVNSDIHFLKDKFYPFISRAAINSFVYGSRVNVETLDNLNGELDPFGFDYFFFDKQIIPYFPSSEFCIGLPSWDHWVVSIPLFYRIPLKAVITHHAYHIKHPINWCDKGVLFRTYLLNHIELLTEEAKINFPFNLLTKYAATISFDDDDDVAKAMTGHQEITRVISDEADIRTIEDAVFKLKI